MAAKKKCLVIIALLLCCVFLAESSGMPMIAYASVGADENDESGDGFDEGSDDTAQEVAVDNTVSAEGVRNKYQGQIDDINKKLDSLEVEKAAIQKEINAAQNAKEKEVANKNSIDRQIYITESEITLLQERIDLLEQSIDAKIIDIDESQAEYDYNYSQFLKRLKNMQLNSQVSQLGAVLGSESFAEYMSAGTMMTKIAEYDKNLMNRVKGERLALEAEKLSLEDDKELLENDRASMEEKKSTLAVQRQSAVSKIQDIDELERQFKADLEKNKALALDMENELTKIFKQIEWETNPYVGGEMTWPVPRFSNITSYYGWRWNKTDYHTGIDISGSGVYGQSIVAANSGKVVFVNTSYVQGRGYGIYLMIDHGGKTSTLYGHCSRVVVSVGDVVQKGQKIAEVGSTGWSTGPHLHFEVRVDGQHTNPLPYLQS